MSSFDASSFLGDLSVPARRPLEACLPPPVSKSQSESLIELLTGKLGAENITLPKDKVLEIIQRLSSPEGSEATVSCARELAEVKDELKILKAHVRLGDYAGKIYNDLQHLCWDSKMRLRAEDLAEELEADVARGTTGNVTDTFQDALDNIPQNLRQSSEMTFDTAKYAVSAYAARNLACHSRSAKLQDEGDWDQLAQLISKDLEELPEYLPDGQIQHRKHWSSIITYFRDSYIFFDEELKGWDGIPEKELFKPARFFSSIDWTILSKQLREIPFETGDYRNLGAEASKSR